MWTALMQTGGDEPCVIHSKDKSDIYLAARAMCSYYHRDVVILEDGDEKDVIKSISRGREGKPVTTITGKRKRVHLSKDILTKEEILG